MGFGEGVGDDLGGMADAELDGVRAGGGEKAVVKSPAAADAASAGIEGKAGAEEDVDFGNRDFRGSGAGFEDAEGAGEKAGSGIDDVVEGEAVALDAGEGPADFRVTTEDRGEVDFAGKGGIGGDGAYLRVIQDPIEKGGLDVQGIGGKDAEEGAQFAAEQGFRGAGRGNCHLPLVGVRPSLAPMMRWWQVTAVFCGMACVAAAEERRQGAFAWEAPEVARSVFTRELGLLDAERDEYATTLAALASNGIAEAKASAASLAAGRKMIALALQLSPRNRRAVVANFQLGKGVLPDPEPTDYSAEAFARLLLTRGQLLEKQGGAQNARLAKYFIQLAAEMDPKNDDAVYASEVQRLDGGAPDWKELTNPEQP